MSEEIIVELRAILERALADGTLNQAEIDRQSLLFQEHFGPKILQQLDGAALLELMHGRKEDQPRCMMYWLEFKNDDEFACKLFGGVAGGSALKFGLYNKEPAGLWLTGSPTAQRPISVEDAISLARRQRDELVAGCSALQMFDPADSTDSRSLELDQAMRAAAPSLYAAGWAHKYWHLTNPDRVDTFHTPQYQRFHLLKLLTMPPDNAGVLDGEASRFACTGRFLKLAQQLGTSQTILGKVLGLRDPYHAYWKVGTTSGSTGESQWGVMRDGSFVSIGWKDFVPDLSNFLKDDDLKDRISVMVKGDYPDPGTAKRKAGEITNFVSKIGVNDIVVVCEGATILGIGRVTGPYEYRPDLAFPHIRAVQWLSHDSWPQSPIEGPRTTVFRFGRAAQNLLNVERRIYNAVPISTISKPPSATTERQADPTSLPQLDEWSARVDAALRRKGQAIFYGPPGTGKTYRALRVAQELAARHAYRKTFEHLTPAERARVVGPRGLVRVCTFHPNWSYEDFLEGVRPTTKDGAISFTERDGLFKLLCDDAASEEGQTLNHFLVIDEINRGDIPRIFGELLTVIELDKRDQSISLPVTGRPLRVPKNVFIIGTMNTADRSISLLDAALRRRFSFIELMPDSRCLSGKTVGGLALGPWLDALNSRLRKHLKRDARNLQVGHAYLLPSSPISSLTEFARILRDDIIPLIEEYCYDDFQTLQKILGIDLVDAEKGCIREELFEPARAEDLKQAVLYEEIEEFSLSDSAVAESESSVALNEDAGDSPDQ
jgi:5-methylcytosine-specific restriction enzyme B